MMNLKEMIINEIIYEKKNLRSFPNKILSQKNIQVPVSAILLPNQNAKLAIVQ